MTRLRSSSFFIFLKNPNQIFTLTNPNPNPPKTLIHPTSNSLLRSIFSSTTHLSNSQSPQPTQTLTPPTPNPRTRTPLEKNFSTWVDKLKPGFTPHDVAQALRSQSDPDLALDIFRWTAQQRNYKHTHLTYYTILEITTSSKRLKASETLIDEVIAGACCGNLSLYNLIIRYCCKQKPLFNRAFDVYKKMLKSPQECKPSLETFTLLLNALLKKFDKLNISYVYLHAVRSLLKQMKTSGVIPDTLALNLIIKAYAKCLDMDGAVRVFREMGLYGCEPNEYTYSYIAKGLCEKGRVSQGFGFYGEMREKGLVPTSSCYVIVICSLALERRFEEASEVMFDMLSNGMVPDVLTYRTLLEGLCREGKGDEAITLLDELRKKEGSMGDRTYRSLLDGLHFINRE